MDLGRRKIVGWATGVSPTAELACRALRAAVAIEKFDQWLLHHSDRGSQYASKTYRRLLYDNGMFGSMSRKGNPYDNAPIESFFQSLKTECLYKHSFHSIEQLNQILRQWINYYNRDRLHSALGWKSPLGYELASYHPFLLSA
jgi:transposase InsO family protein